MSDIAESLRAAVTARAANRCEYCQLPAQWQVGRFPIDHVVPRSSGGRTELDNLALACPHCNAHKWAHTNGIDPISGALALLYNPRSDVWLDHFGWSTVAAFEIAGKTPIGRATANRLQMNRADVIVVRQLLGALGIFPEASP